MNSSTTKELTYLLLQQYEINQEQVTHLSATAAVQTLEQPLNEMYELNHEQGTNLSATAAVKNVAQSRNSHFCYCSSMN